MDDIAIRNWIYTQFVETQRAPRVEDIAAEFELTAVEAEAVLLRLHDAHLLVLEPGRPEILMLSPFSCVPTPYRVRAGDGWWYANCGWDAFGVLSALHSDGHISASCPDCAEPIEIDVRAGRPEQDDLVFHVL